jgi:hypothetical protein
MSPALKTRRECLCIHIHPPVCMSTYIHTHTCFFHVECKPGGYSRFETNTRLQDMNSCNGRTIVPATDCDLIFCCVVRCCKVRAETYCFTADAIWLSFGPPTIREFATRPPPPKPHTTPQFRAADILRHLFISSWKCVVSK